MYKIVLEKSVQKFLKKHRTEPVKEVFSEAISLLALDAYENNLDIKILEWLPNSYRLRIGKYRFLYEILDDVLVISFFDAGTRWAIYKKYS